MLTLVLPDWRFSSGAFIDPWVYHGYFRHLRAFTTDLFPGTYYGTRLGWIVPGQLAYALFDGHVASFVLHSIFFVVGVLSLYEIVRAIAGPRPAFAGAVLFGLSLQWIRAVGADYVDGPVITYALVSTMLLQRALGSGSWSAMVGSGIAAGAMIHSNIGAVLLVPPILIWLAPWRLDASIWQQSVQRLFQWLLGATLCTLALAQVSVMNGAPWAFFMPSLTWQARMGTENPWEVPGVAWMARAPWLFLTAGVLLTVAIVAATPSRRARLDEQRLRAVAALTSTVVIFLIWDYVGFGAMLSVPFYASWLVPFSVIALSAAVFGTTDVTRAGTVVSIAIGVALIAVAASAPEPPGPAWARLAVLAALASGAALVGSGALSIALAGLFAVALQTSLAADWYFSPRANRADIFNAVNRGVLAADRHIGDSTRLLFLLEQNVGLRPYFDSLASVYLHGYVVITDKYPSLAEKPKYQITPGSLVVIASGREERERLQEVFASHGVVGRIRGEERIPTKAGMLHLTFVRAVAQPPSGT